MTTWTGREGGGGQKMSVLVHAQSIKTFRTGWGGKKWQNSVHIVVECPLRQSRDFLIEVFGQSQQRNK